MATNKELQELHARCDSLYRAINKRDALVEALVVSNKGLADRLAQVLAQVGTLNEKVEALTKAQAVGLPISNINKAHHRPQSRQPRTHSNPRHEAVCCPPRTH